MSEVAASEHFGVGELIGLDYLPSHGVYYYFVRSSGDIRERSPRTNLYFDGDPGKLRFLDLPTGRWAGNTFVARRSAYGGGVRPFLSNIRRNFRRLNRDVDGYRSVYLVAKETSTYDTLE
jgi:hypothetical protein